MVAAEVERVFAKRGWKSFAQAELATGIPNGTLKRLRNGLGKADTIERFGVAAGEPASVWKRIAVGLSPDGNGDLAEVRDSRETENETIRIYDSQEIEAIKYLRDIPAELRQNAVEGLRLWSEAKERLREKRTARSIGKTSDREENPTLRENSEAGRAEARAEQEATARRREREQGLRDAEKLMDDDPEASLAAARAHLESLREKDKEERGFRKK